MPAMRTLILLLALAAPASAAPMIDLVPPLTLSWFERQSEAFAVDDGGGAALSGRGKVVLSYVLALFIGLGTGHLLMGHDDDFIFFLIVDAVLIVAGNLGFFGPFGKIGGGIAGALLFASHVWQVIDLYGRHGGSGGPAKMRTPTRGSDAWANGLVLSF